MDKGLIFDIQHASFVDGPGVRTTVFFKGCNLRCAWCHNPESQGAEREMLYYRDTCTDCGKCREVCQNGLEGCTLCGKCEAYCPSHARTVCGKEMTVDMVLSEVVKDKAFYENSGGGVTFSGGECMLQIDFLEALLRACRENGIHTAVDTAGYVPYTSFERILPFTDLFLYDIKIATDALHKKYIGVSNKLILKNLRRLSESGANILIRIPVIGGVNDSDEEMNKIAELLRGIRHTGVELLPYHALGEHKYAALGKESYAFAPPSAERLAYLKKMIFKEKV